MAKGIVLEFSGVGRADYDAVNRHLGIDTTRPNTDWPPGLQLHAATVKAGGLFVFEVWDSQEAQDRFMRERLGPALAKGGITQPPTRVEWMDVLACTKPA